MRQIRMNEARADQRSDEVDSTSATPLPPASTDHDQLFRQVRRILEQLVALDEQYRDVILEHDQSALEALSACTVALSKLIHVRLNESRATSAPREDSPTIHVGKIYPSNQRRTG